jgi:SAM-dependent methyltransferase
MQQGLYTSINSDYLKNNKTWHVEDSQWKAEQVFKLIRRNDIKPNRVVEIGCGAGEILVQMNNLINDPMVSYEGYDISPDAFELSKERESTNIKFFNQNLLTNDHVFFDLCLIMDVIEHVENCFDFIKQCGKKATYKIYHIPLDLHVSSLLRNKPIETRNSVGHIHFFTKDTALATLSDSGQEIIDYFYTPLSFETPNKSFKTKIANLFRRALFSFLPDFSVRLIGGYSLIVLTK